MPFDLKNKIDIKLIKSFISPSKNIAACAKTCYSARGIVSDEKILFPKDEELILDIFRAGHHTNFEHAYFQFAVDNVSRQTVWSLLHSHRFYNSEEVSQRYTEVRDNFYYLPALGEMETVLFTDTIKAQHDNYKKLIELLAPVVEKEYFNRFPARRKEKDKHQSAIKRKCQEVARYVLPIGTLTYLYHTINLITIIRYYFSLNSKSTDEEIEVVDRFIHQIYKCDPDLKGILKKIFDEKESYRNDDDDGIRFSRKMKNVFDSELSGLSSKLIDYIFSAEKTLADSVRLYYGKLPDEMDNNTAIELILNPEKNRILSKSLVLTHNDNLNRALNHVKYVFKKKISHTADSQNQRHRTIPSSKSDLINEDFYDPDFIVPAIIKNNPGLQETYHSMMDSIWGNIKMLLDQKVARKKVIYLLPNAYPIRMIESGSLLNYHHKYALRLCYNAQEEIWNNSIDEVKQIRKVHPEIGKYILPPCSLRNLSKSIPVCPEGKRYCGVKVWNLDIEKYNRMI